MEKNNNLLFYKNELSSKPEPGATISEVLSWKGDYKKLENFNSYIEWLFPILEDSLVSSTQQPLQEDEAKAIIETDPLRGNVLEAFKMMLDMFGMELVDENTGEVRKHSNWKERYEFLTKSDQVHTVITRMLLALGELGFEHLQTPLIEFLMLEATVNKALPNFDMGHLNDWISTVKVEEEQTILSHKWQQLKEATLMKPETNANI